MDFDRLNEGELRVTITAVELRSGEEVMFDNRSMRLELDHVMAGAALIPDFPPVEIDGRLHVDGGLSANLPIHLPLAECLATPDRERLTCFAVDLFALSAPLPMGIVQAAQRQSDLIFASQTSRTYRAMSQLWSGAEPGADVFHVSYLSPDDETAMKGFDFSAGILERRRATGRIDMGAAIDLWRASRAPVAGLTIHAARI